VASTCPDMCVSADSAVIYGSVILLRAGNSEIRIIRYIDIQIQRKSGNEPCYVLMISNGSQEICVCTRELKIARLE